MSEQHFSTPQPVRLEIRVAAGDLHVATVDGDQSTVTLEGSQRLLDAMRVELVGDRLVIDQRRKSFMSFLGHFDEPLQIRAHIPHASRVSIVTASGDATLDGSFGGLELQSASGGVVATGELDGDATVKTVSGSVRLGHVSGDLVVKTVSGDAAADSVGRSVSAQSVSGDVRVGSLHEGSVNVQNVSGDVELGIASGTSIDVDAGSASGDLRSEVPLSDRPGEDSGRRVVIRGNTVSGNFRVFQAA